LQHKEKSSKKKEEYHNLTVYFSLVVSSEVDPKEINEQGAHKWVCNGETSILIKELQDIYSEMVVSLFRLSMATRKEVILVEPKKILIKVQNLAQQESSDMTLHNFSMELDVMKSLPDMNLQVQNAKLRGQEVAIFSKLNNRAQMSQQSWHLKGASKYAFRMKELVQYTKESGRVNTNGENTHT
jgi:hypothetical protein